MEILSSKIDDNTVRLVTDETVVSIVLLYGNKEFEHRYVKNMVHSKDITITKEEMDMESLSNRYFHVRLWGESGEIECETGLYNINVTNEKDSQLYNANRLKQELDNLNYYDGLLQKLTQKKRYLEALDLFFNYMDFLENRLNGNNFIQALGRSNKT